MGVNLVAGIPQRAHGAPEFGGVMRHHSIITQQNECRCSVAARCPQPYVSRLKLPRAQKLLEYMVMSVVLSCLVWGNGGSTGHLPRHGLHNRQPTRTHSLHTPSHSEPRLLDIPVFHALLDIPVLFTYTATIPVYSRVIAHLATLCLICH